MSKRITTCGRLLPNNIWIFEPKISFKRINVKINHIDGRANNTRVNNVDY